MTFIAKPRLHHPTLHTNKVGYTRRDYEGRISTLCAGCGHDSISAAVIQACWELDIEPHRVAKLSGIGCSSKTPDYFLGAPTASTPSRAHALGADRANLANRDLLYLGVRATATRPRLVWASLPMPCDAACAWPTSSKTMASTA